MNMDILAILMVAFGLFAILLFILFYIYARNARNKQRENDDYEEDLLRDDKYKNIDKDFDNLVDEDIKKDDIKGLNLETDNVDDFKDDGSLRGDRLIAESSQEEIVSNPQEVNELDEFIPKKKI